MSNLANIQANLKGNVATLLVTQYDFTLDEAEEKINKSFESSPDIWNENADSTDIAKLLADEDEE